MRLQSIILMTMLCAVSWAARAQPIQGVYVGAGAGALLPLPTKNSSLTPGITGHFDINQSLGYGAQLSAGYALGNGWRFELEGTFGRATVKGTAGTAFPATGTGSIQNIGVMANALFDLDVGSPYVYPYLGLGAGYQSTRLNGFRLASIGSPLSFSASGEQGGLAAQAIVGVSFPIPNMPGLSITVDYRIMDILGGEKFSGATSFGPPAGSVAGTTQFHNQYDQTAMIGVRFAFNTPPPPGAVPPTPAPIAAAQSKTYLVYFALNQATLSDRAQGIVKEAAQSGANSRIDVTGNADTSGNASANQALSERRAKVVAAALIADGVPKDAISIQARGDTSPAVPTGPGVVEQQNRRVEIITH